jgi:hypothetical protein
MMAFQNGAAPDVDHSNRLRHFFPHFLAISCQSVFRLSRKPRYCATCREEGRRPHETDQTKGSAPGARIEGKDGWRLHKMTFVKRFGGAVCALALMATAGLAQDQSTNRVATITDWNVFVDNDPKECWGVSVPKESVNTQSGRVVAVNRGQTLLMVFYRPGAGAMGQVAFTGGYPFASGSTVTLDVSGTEFALFTEGDWAWPASTAEDAKIIAAMKRGAQAVLSGVSGRGTNTKDTFSLLGFTAAVEDAEKRCSG